MIRDFVEYVGATTWPQIALIIFMIAFIAVIVWTFIGPKKRFDEQSRLPLDDSADKQKKDLDFHHE